MGLVAAAISAFSTNSAIIPAMLIIFSLMVQILYAYLDRLLSFQSTLTDPYATYVSLSDMDSYMPSTVNHGI